jgi:hypothetical protein
LFGVKAGMKFPIIKNKEEFDEHFQSHIWFDTAKQICGRHQISFTELNRFVSKT